MENLNEQTPYLAQIRSLCLSFPGTSERSSHGAPSFFIDDKRNFLQYRLNHHGDGRIAIWCASPPGAQSSLTASDPELFYIPAYVGHLGWIGMRLDREASWEHIEVVIGDAYLARAPRKYLNALKAKNSDKGGAS